MLTIRDRLDRFGVLLSGLCALHCLASIFLIAGLGLGGQALLAPVIHRAGLALAVAVGAVTLGVGMLRHKDPLPFRVGGAGLALMFAALFVPHGLPEAVLTIAGVTLLGWAHLRNLRLGA